MKEKKTSKKENLGLGRKSVFYRSKARGRKKCEKKNEKTRFVFDARTLADLAEPLGLGILTKFLNKFSLNKNMARR